MPRRKKKYTVAPVETAPAPMPATITPRYLNARDAAVYMGFKTVVTFWRWAKQAIKDGLLHPNTKMRSWLYDREEIDKAFAIQSGRKKAA